MLLLTMSVPIFKIVNLVILLVVMTFLIRYIWDLFYGSDFEPVEWEEAKKAGKIPPALLKAMKNTEDKIRFYTIWLQLERLKKEKVDGCFAELGVYKGESARMILLMDGSREFQLFDTFDGLPEKDLQLETGEAAAYTNRNFKDTSLDKVKKTLGKLDNITFHVGYFPGTTLGLDEKIYAFVNLDADLYSPTQAALSYFYPRLAPGGVIMIHDYNHKWEGLQKAVDEFSTTIPEIPVLVPDLFGSVMIIKSKLAARP